MKKKIAPFPVIDDVQKYGCSFVPKFKSVNGVELESNCDLGFFQITDCAWSPVDPLVVEFLYSIDKPNLLFVDDGEVSPIASKDSKIGLAIRSVCRKAHEQQVFIIPDSIRAGQESVKGRYKLTLPAKAIYFGVKFELFLFVAKPHQTNDNDIYATDVGSILGSMAVIELVTGGGGGFFSTKSEKLGKNLPLWRVDCEITSEDDFDMEFTEDVFKLVLNEDHPLYPYAVTGVGTKGISPVLLEIMADAFTIFIYNAVKVAPLTYDFPVSDDPDSVIVGDVLSSLKSSFFYKPNENMAFLKSLEIGKLHYIVRERLACDQRIKLLPVSHCKGI